MEIRYRNPHLCAIEMCAIEIEDIIIIIIIISKMFNKKNISLRCHFRHK
jgi:hypothetical protein